MSEQSDMPLRLAWMTPEELADNPANWRRHPSEQVSALNAAVGQVGWAGAALYNERTSRLIDGHCRKKINPEHLVDGRLPVLIGNWSEDQERTILLTLDPLAGLAETDATALESLMRDVQIADEALAAMVAGMAEEAGIIPPEETTTPVDVEPQTDRAEELQRQWQTAPGQLWEIVGKSGMVHRLLCGDSANTEDVALVLNGERAAIVGDPPYGISVDTSWLSALNVKRGKPACKSDYRLQGDDGTLDLSWVYTWPEWLVFGFPFIARDEKFTGLLVWDKRGDGGEDGLGNPVEVAASNCFNGYRLKRHVWAGYVREAGEKRQPHPTQKPVGIMQDAIELVKASVVLDGWAGSGTTIIAADNLGRRCCALEIDPKYCAVILQRCLDSEMQPRLLSPV